MEFWDDLEHDPLAPDTGRKMRRELRQLAAFRALEGCRCFLISYLCAFTLVMMVGSYHVPVPLYALLSYFLAYLLIGSWADKYKTPEFLLDSLRLSCHYSYRKYLTEQASLWFAFLLLAAVQYSFLYTVHLNSVLLSFSPAAAAILLLLGRYPGAMAAYYMLRRSIYRG